MTISKAVSANDYYRNNRATVLTPLGHSSASIPNTPISTVVAEPNVNADGLIIVDQTPSGGAETRDPMLTW